MRLRFAPSPTGFVHVGNARTALFNYLHARRRQGTFVLRIEDTDVERSEREYEENLIRDLNWLGIEWDEGPDIGGDYAPYRQSERTETYRTYARKLIDNGFAYYCFCSPEELQKEKETSGGSGYSGKCRALDIEASKQRVQAGEAAAVRFKVPADREVVFYDLVREKVVFDSNLLSDPVILRSTGIPAYNFSVVIDDYLMGITLVVRGDDHISNTSRQVLIYEALCLDIPKFAHLSMVMGEDNTKLSKRHGSTSIQQFREQGYLPEALFNYLSLLGWSPGGNSEVLTKNQLLTSFNLKKVSKSAAIFDYQKLKWLNREHIRLKSDEELGRIMVPFMQAAGFLFEEDEKTLSWIARAAKVLSNYNYLLPEIAADFKQFTSFDCPTEIIDSIITSESASKVIAVLRGEIESLDSPIAFYVIGEIAKKIQAEHSIKGRELYHPIRLALTGKESGIELKDFIPLIEDGSLLNITPPVINMKKRLEQVLSNE
jgi:glutamyl-tRNA synthetase